MFKNILSILIGLSLASAAQAGSSSGVAVPIPQASKPTMPKAFYFEEINDFRFFWNMAKKDAAHADPEDNSTDDYNKNHHSMTEGSEGSHIEDGKFMATPAFRSTEVYTSVKESYAKFIAYAKALKATAHDCGEVYSKKIKFESLTIVPHPNGFKASATLFISGKDCGEAMKAEGNKAKTKAIEDPKLRDTVARLNKALELDKVLRHEHDLALAKSRNEEKEYLKIHEENHRTELRNLEEQSHYLPQITKFNVIDKRPPKTPEQLAACTAEWQNLCHLASQAAQAAGGWMDETAGRYHTDCLLVKAGCK